MYIIKKGPTFFPPQLLLNPQITYKKKKGKKKDDKPGHYKAAHFVPDTIKYAMLH